MGPCWEPTEESQRRKGDDTPSRGSLDASLRSSSSRSQSYRSISRPDLGHLTVHRLGMDDLSAFALHRESSLPRESACSKFSGECTA